MTTERATKGTTRRINVILRDDEGNPESGLGVSLRIRQQSSGLYLQNDGSWLSNPASDPSATELDVSNIPGIYYFDFEIPDQVDTYLIRVDGSSSSIPQYLFGVLQAVTDRDGDLKLAKAVLANKQQQAIDTGVVTIMDDDHVSPLLTLTPSVDDVSNPSINILSPS